MSFLITQMWICLALAFLLGGLLAWLLLARPLASRLAESESMWAKKNKVLGADRDKQPNLAINEKKCFEPSPY